MCQIRSAPGSASRRSASSQWPRRRVQAARSAAMFAAMTQPQFCSWGFCGEPRSRAGLVGNLWARGHAGQDGHAVPERPETASTRNMAASRASRTRNGGTARHSQTRLITHRERTPQRRLAPNADYGRIGIASVVHVFWAPIIALCARLDMDFACDGPPRHCAATRASESRHCPRRGRYLTTRSARSQARCRHPRSRIPLSAGPDRGRARRTGGPHVR
jgi:hypothetical protein